MTRDFQKRVAAWMQVCFGPVIAADRTERNFRFLEESLELVQALGMTRHEALDLVDYVFGRPTGEPGQELGGVMVTLAALAGANDLSITREQTREIERVSDPRVMRRIRAKQAAKPLRSPLPGPDPKPQVTRRKTTKSRPKPDSMSTDRPDERLVRCRVEIDLETGHATMRYRWSHCQVDGHHRHDEDVRDWTDDEIRRVCGGLIDCPDDQLARIQIVR